MLGKLTLQGGVRFDQMTQRFPEQIVGFTRFIPNGFIVPESTGVDWNDITPRMAAAYDLPGDGKTAVKFTLGKYMVAQDGGGVFGANLNPTARLGHDHEPLRGTTPTATSCPTATCSTRSPTASAARTRTRTSARTCTARRMTRT